jgi:hypothetical protein
VDELMMRIGGEVWRFAPTGHDHAGPVLWHAWLHFDSRRQVHQQADR